MTTHRKFWTWSLSRGDYVVLRLALFLAPLLYGLYNLAPRLADWITGAPLHWRTLSDAEAPTAIPTLGGATVRFVGMVEWTIPEPEIAQRWWSLVPTALVTILIALGAVCLWRLVTAVRSGDAFGGAAVAYVRALAVLVLSYAVLVKVLRTLVDFLVTAPSQPTPATYFTITPGSLLAFAVGLLLLALAEGFRQGRQLRTDAEGLV